MSEINQIFDKITIMNVGHLIPYDKNSRTHPDEQVSVLSDAIKEYGFDQPIVVDENNVIIKGHGRLLAAKKLGLSEVPVIKNSDLSDIQKKALRISDNKISQLSGWNDELLFNELKELSENGFDNFESIGFLGSELSNLEIELDKCNEKDDSYVQDDDNIESVVKSGQIWELGDHRLLCADSTKLENFEKLFEDKKADLLLTDPPYGVNYVGISKKRDKIENDELTGDNLFNFLNKVFNNSFKFINNCKQFYVWFSLSNYSFFEKSLIENGFINRQVLIWVKNHFNLSHSDYHNKYEPCFYGFNSKNDRIWNGGRNKSTILEYNKPSNNDIHPTQKPVEMINHLIYNSTNKNGVIMDPFLGSGTTLISSEITDRICYGMEILDKYCDAIIKRWETLTNKKAKLIG